MRTVLAVVCVLTITLLSAPLSRAEEVQTAKVYRDYPGYIDPAACDNPNLARPPVAEDAVPAPAAQKPATGVRAECPPAACWLRPDDPVGYYLAAWAGIVATHDLDVARATDLSIDNGYGLGLAAGYDFGPVRFEVEGSQRRSDADKVRTGGASFEARADLKVETVLINAYADFATGGPLTPYLGVGGGYARARVDDHRDRAGVGQLAAGVLAAISPRLAVDFGYRYLLPVSRSEFELRQHTALLGLQFRF